MSFFILISFLFIIIILLKFFFCTALSIMSSLLLNLTFSLISTFLMRISWIWDSNLILINFNFIVLFCYHSCIILVILNTITIVLRVTTFPAISIMSCISNHWIILFLLSTIISFSFFLYYLSLNWLSWILIILELYIVLSNWGFSRTRFHWWCWCLWHLVYIASIINWWKILWRVCTATLLASYCRGSSFISSGCCF